MECPDVTRLRAAYKAAGQEHVFQFYDKLNAEEKQILIRETERYNPQELNDILESGKRAQHEIDCHLQRRPPHKVSISFLSALEHHQQQSHQQSHQQQQQQSHQQQQQQSHQQQQQPQEHEEQQGIWMESYRKLLPEAAACSVVSLKETPQPLRQKWSQLGLRLIAEGKVGVIILAGGDGSRLGWNGVKGAFSVGPLSGTSLFRLFAQRIRRVLCLAAEAADGTSKSSSINNNRRFLSLPLYIMTSETNRAQTEAVFTDAEYFGLNKTDVHFFTQAASPVFDLQGRLMLASPCHLRRAPDGNGGILSALRTSGTLQNMKERGLMGVQVLAIDNALAKVADPTFYGFAVSSGSQVANKVVSRRSSQESVGLMCEVLTDSPCLFPAQTEHQHQQQPQQEQQRCRWAGSVVEYTELPKALAETTPEGGPDECPFAWANICMHYFRVNFIEAVATNADLLHSRYHLALKKIPELRPLPGGPYEPSDLYDPAKWALVTPDKANGWKLELFIFDVFPLADKIMCLEVDRDEEFAPVKSSNPTEHKIDANVREGELNLSWVAPDTPHDAQVRMSRLHAKWLEAATGQQLPFRQGKEGRHVFCEISPLRSYEGEGLGKDCLEGKDLSRPLLLE